MLILMAKIGQRILIDNGVVQLKVLGVNDGIISIGFNAPSNIEIDREEIYLKKLIQRNKTIGLGTKALG